MASEVQRKVLGSERWFYKRETSVKRDWGQRWAVKAGGVWRLPVDYSSGRKLSAREKKVFGRLSPNIWACRKSVQKLCQDCWMMIRRSVACRCVRTSQNVFKLNQGWFIESSLDIWVRLGNLAAEQSVEVFDVTEAEKSKTKLKLKVDHFLRCQWNRPLRVLSIRQDDQAEKLQGYPGVYASLSACEETRVVAGQIVAASPR